MTTLNCHQALGLTGHVISAVTKIPYSIGIREDRTVKLEPQPYNYLLLDDFPYRQDSATWRHTLIGWSGEIQPISNTTPVKQLDQGNALSKLSAVDRETKNTMSYNTNPSDFTSALQQYFNGENHSLQDVVITKAQREEARRLLEHACNCRIVPVWLGDWLDEPKEMLQLRDQARWTNNARMLLQDPTTVNGTPKDKEFFDACIADYRKMSESTADAIIEIYKPGDVVWIHSIELMFLPDILRRKIPSAYVFYSPPAKERWKNWSLEIFEDLKILPRLLQSSLININGQDCRRITGSCIRPDKVINTTDGRRVAIIDCSIIPFKSAPQINMVEKETIEKHTVKLREAYRDQKIIVAIVDFQKPQIIRGILESFVHFLDHNAGLQRKVVLLLINTPPALRNTMISDDPNDLDNDNAKLASDINRRFGPGMGQPIVYINRASQELEYLSRLKIADVCIVTADDICSCLEVVNYIILRQANAKPVMIFKPVIAKNECTILEDEYTTTTTVTSVNAARIQKALDRDVKSTVQMNDRLLSLRTKYKLAKLANHFLTTACSLLAKLQITNRLPSLDSNALAETYRTADRRLFMFDYDGTLTQIVDEPDAALPSQHLIKCLDNLAANCKNTVWIISGRSRAFLDMQFGNVKLIGLIAEHGSFVRRRNQDTWEDLSANMDMTWKAKTQEVFDQLVESVNGSWIERKEVAMVWHYRTAIDHEACLAKAVKAKSALENEKLKEWDVEVMLGKANLEVRPRFLSKGAMAVELIKETFAEETAGFVLCAGDDTTDEGKPDLTHSSKEN